MGQDNHAYLTDIGIHEAMRKHKFTRTWRHRRFTHEYEEDVDLEITEMDDVHAFGMTVFEVCLGTHRLQGNFLTLAFEKVYTRTKPFPSFPDSRKTVLTLVRNGFPQLLQPVCMPKPVWELVLACTGRNGERPGMREVEDRLHDLLGLETNNHFSDDNTAQST